ncbi:Uncharacterised protein [Halioglobus japonicus]|nr:Uncharacterised protein [Halioglobus japonicus]
MLLANLIENYLDRYKTRYGKSTTPDQWSALNAILGCRSGQYGELLLACQGCPHTDSQPRSCGHRSCNACQSHSTQRRLERQQAKLLPVDYFMVTFTLPFELRAVATMHPTVVYGLLLQCATAIIKTFGRNDKNLLAELGMTAVLHTHTRRLDYHPHVHLIVPGGGVNRARREWRKLKGEYLFNGNALAAAFRGRMLAALEQVGLQTFNTPREWVVHCTKVGRGLPALKYLSRYLYRGVISNENLLQDDGTHVTFQYRDSKTGELQTRCERGEDIIALILQHTLPKGFRRTRDYGFLHGNAKALLKTVQWALQISVPLWKQTPRPAFTCKHCHSPMALVGFKSRQSSSG